ncbi:MAG: hypothetical protein ACREEM_03980, partial [Blastocatellia bacterium]
MLVTALPSALAKNFEPIFLWLCRPMCGRSSTFRGSRAYLSGYAPTFGRCKYVGKIILAQYRGWGLGVR